MYQEQDFVTVAKRENNKKRNYLVVNHRQGKHIPVSPKEALEMFYALADIVKQENGAERLLIIGFAETATAIGAAVAAELGQSYIQTTRENVEGVEDYFYFSEAHSHATEQKVVRTDIDRLVYGKCNGIKKQGDSKGISAGDKQIDRIVFVEDEVTTGNTILSAIAVMEKVYGKEICYSVASILNGMDSAAEERFHKRKIPLHYLVKIDNTKYPQIAERIRGDGKYINNICYNIKCLDSNNIDNGCSEIKHEGSILLANRKADGIKYQGKAFEQNISYRELLVGGYHNARRLQNAKEYQAACEQLCKQVYEQMHQKRSILVLGTEEFMYPALILAAKLEKQGCYVRFHATTRSPIAVSTEPDYPLHTRYELISMYDRERRTFIYNLAAYDEVIIVSDASNLCPEAKYTLCKALVDSGNQQITFVQWRAEGYNSQSKCAKEG